VGDHVTISGVVTDGGGRPLSSVRVGLRASRTRFGFRDLWKRRLNPTSVGAITGEDGSFEIDWPWQPGYNRHELVAGVVVGKPAGEEEFRVLARIDLSRRIRHGNPVVATLEIEDTAFLDSFLEFLSTVDSEDERRVYQEMGNPDKVRHEEFSEHGETSWWYFEQGKVYRFRDGEVDSVDQFEPIEPNSG
jgi:hypothetical protein